MSKVIPSRHEVTPPKPAGERETFPQIACRLALAALTTVVFSISDITA